MGFIKVGSTKGNLNSISNIFNEYLFGDKSVSEYNPNVLYNKDDLVYIIQNGKLYLYKAMEDNIIGSFDISKWNDYNIRTEIGTGELRVVEISDVTPTKNSVNIWLKPIREEVYNLPTIFT